MLSTFQDFINHDIRYQKLESDAYFKSVFNFLSEAQNIYNMIEASKRNKPALSGCVTELEERFPDLLKQPYKDHFIKPAIGAMIKEILAPFGYTPLNPKKLSPDKNKVFNSAHVYHLEERSRELEIIPSWKIVKV